ncbi:MAG: acyl-CoA dehydrogenase family protein [Actinomycetota bacterium]|nr:acyl-CoA/acyl-ACP dehydrogenase [Actinomycetota bacterium]
MDFSLTDDQRSLRDSIRGFLATECPSSLVRKSFEDDEVTSGLWSKMAQLGWAGLLVGEGYGGVDLGWVEAVLLAQEAASALAPAPILGSLAVSQTISKHGDDALKARWLPSIADGTAIASFAIFESRSTSVDDIVMKARPTASGYALEGTKLFVPDATRAGVFLVAVVVEGELRFAVVGRESQGVDIEPLPTVDLTRPQGAVTFTDVEISTGDLLDANCSFESLRTKVSLLVSAELAGITRRCLQMCVEYSKQRVQFGKPIGVYQAVSHKIADMYLAAEHAESLTHYAAWCVDEDQGADLAVWRARLWSSQAATKTTSDAIQVHGGIGFTWEHDLHLYFKRARSDEYLLDEPQRLSEAISRAAHGS